MKKLFIPILVFIVMLTTLAPAFADDQPLIPNNALFYYSSNFLLMDMDDGSVLFERNGYKAVHPASITKVSTLISALELIEAKKLKITDTMTLSAEVFAGIPTIASVAGFLIGETVTLEDLMYGIIMPSGADATRALSNHLTGDPEGLSESMNALVKKIGLTNTHFVNTSGLDDDNHLSTPYDLARIVQYGMKNPEFVKYYTALEYTTSKTRQHPTGIHLVNRSLEYGKKLIPELFTGAKSGYTEKAERSLSSVSMVNGSNLIFVSTNAPNEDLQSTNITDAVQTYRYMNRNYRKLTLLDAQSDLLSLPVQNSKQTIKISTDTSIRAFIPKDTPDSAIRVETTATNPNLVAPVLKGDLVGKTDIFINDKLFKTITHLAPETIGVSMMIRLQKIGFFVLKAVLVAVLVLFGLGFAIRTYNIEKARRRREKRPNRFK